jgi:hypothetical protein
LANDSRSSEDAGPNEVAPVEFVLLAALPLVLDRPLQVRCDRLPAPVPAMIDRPWGTATVISVGEVADIVSHHPRNLANDSR